MADALPATATATGVRFGIRVIPRASRDAIGGTRDGRLLVRVTAPPVDQAASRAAVTALAAALKVPERRLTITSGATSRNKTVEADGIGLDTLSERLGPLIPNR